MQCRFNFDLRGILASLPLDSDLKGNSMKTYISILSRTFGLLSVTSLLAVGGGLSAADVTQPGDPIVATSANESGDGAVVNAIDNNTATKYLNLDKVNTGFTVTPSVGDSRVT